MRRRKLAWALAALLALLALLAASAWAVLVLPARDYRLAYLLGKTKKIEFSSAFSRGAEVEIADPGEVAEIVSAATAKLDRARIGTRRVWALQARFVLDDGREVVILSLPFELFRDDVDSPERRKVIRTFAVRFPGRTELEEYETSGLDAALLDRANDLHRRAVELGRFQVSDETWKLLLRQDRSFSRPAISFERIDALKTRFFSTLNPKKIEHRLLSATGAVLPSGPVGGYMTERSDVHIPIDDVARVELVIDGKTIAFPVPPVRRRDPVVPTCPKCGSFERVVPLAYPPGTTEARCFHGKCKKIGTPWHVGSPELWCDRCQASF